MTLQRLCHGLHIAYLAKQRAPWLPEKFFRAHKSGLLLSITNFGPQPVDKNAILPLLYFQAHCFFLKQNAA